MDRYNWYSGMIVSDTHMDTAFSNVWAGEKMLRIGHGLSQALAAGAPTALRHGGILNGGIVTRSGVLTKTVEVTDLKAIDELGRFITLGGTATIALSHTGSVANSEIGYLTPLTWNGAAISVPAGEERWLSLWVGYAELLSDSHNDISGTPVYLQVDESFLFKVEIGAASAAPATDRSALIDGWVLLTDILIEENGGDYRIKTVGSDAICGSNEDLDVIGYGLDDVAALPGRRSDWVTAEDSTNYPQARSGGDQIYSLRAGTPRAALEDIVQTLQRQVRAAGPPIEPVGTEIIGARAQAGAGLGLAIEAAASLPVGSLDEQLLYVLNQINEKLGRGGGVLDPPATADGIIATPTTLSHDKALICIKGSVAGAIVDRVKNGTKYGHQIAPPRFLDHFLWYQDIITMAGVDKAVPWFGTTNDDGEIVILNEVGGIAQLQTGSGSAAIGEFTTMSHQLGPIVSARPWSCGASPFCIATIRFKAPSVADVRFRFGFYSDGPSSFTADALNIEFDSSVDANLHAIGYDSAHAAGTDVAILTPLDTNYHTVRIVAISTSAWAVQLDGGAWLDINAGGANFAAVGYTFGMYVETLVNAEKTLSVDLVDIEAGALDADYNL